MKERLEPKDIKRPLHLENQCAYNITNRNISEKVKLETKIQHIINNLNNLFRRVYFIDRLNRIFFDNVFIWKTVLNSFIQSITNISLMKGKTIGEVDKNVYRILPQTTAQLKFTLTFLDIDVKMKIIKSLESLKTTREDQPKVYEYQKT